MKNDLIKELRDLTVQPIGYGKEIINQLILPLLKQCERENLLDVIVAELQEKLRPIYEKVNCEAYDKFYSEEQLSIYLEFLKQNPWFIPISAECSIWLTQEMALRNQEVVGEVMKKYLGDLLDG